jgi:hypothetical protein
VRAVPGRERWLSLTVRFPGGLWSDEAWDRLQARSSLLHADEVFGIPVMPEEAIWPEVQSWSGPPAGSPGGLQQQVYPGQCPTAREAGKPDREYVAILVNDGVAHSSKHHYDQALTCWHAARAILQLYQQPLEGVEKGRTDGSVSPDDLAAYLDVVDGNIEAVRRQEWRPYSYEAPVLERALRLAFCLECEAAPALVVPSPLAAELEYYH